MRDMPATDRAEAESSDETLMARAATGDRPAFGTLARRHGGRAIGIAYRVVGRRAEAEELAQEAFIRAWTHAARFKPPSEPGGAKFTTWFQRILVNLCIDWRRRAKPLALDEVPEPSYPATGVEDLARRRMSERVKAAILRLPARQRTALALCFYEGFSNIEAGAAMGLSVGAVESLLVRARRVLREELKDMKAELGE